MNHEQLQEELASRLRKWAKRWKFQRYQVVCLGCQRGQALVLAQAAEPFFHGEGCPSGREAAPWTDLQLSLGDLARSQWQDIEAAAVIAAANPHRGNAP